MTTRRRIQAEEAAASSYFAKPGDKGDVRFFSSGCAGVDAALGGGWALGRVSNIVGDRSSGKTLLAIEASANFAHEYKDGLIAYREAEAAFDKSYAEALGMPIDRISFDGKPQKKKKTKERDMTGDDVERPRRSSKAEEEPEWKMETVEDFYEDMCNFLDECEAKKVPGLYILDSLDALSDDAEMAREFGDTNTFGASKPKKMTELFRKLVRRIEKMGVHLMVISQLKEKIGVQFGERKTRAGGKALDYYASHIVWLAEDDTKITKTIEGVKRVIGLSVRARVKKNKVGLAHREFSYPVLFGYGIDDMTANVEWLIDVKRKDRLAEVDLSEAGYKISIAAIRDKGGERAREMRKKLRAILFQEWERIESKFLPKASKY
jgi:recombination protein RecA